MLRPGAENRLSHKLTDSNLSLPFTVKRHVASLTAPLGLRAIVIDFVTVPQSGLFFFFVCSLELGFVTKSMFCFFP